ncbi:MAG: STAS domain-containing protein [Candidatus Eisenbacteria bacterium]
MTFDREKRGDVHILTPKKDLQGGEETRELERAIQEIMAEGTPKIVVDLGRISFLNSTGLGSLVASHSGCANRGGWMRLARIGKRIKNLFLVTKLALVFETFDSVDEAVTGENK